MTPMLKRFYQELQGWIDDGQPRGSIFEPDCGLCHNIKVWAYNQDIWRVDELAEEQAELFVDAGLDIAYPFDDDSDSYLRAWAADAMYTSNPARLAWIKEHAQ